MLCLSGGATSSAVASKNDDAELYENYYTEYARSNRSSCHGCVEKIDKACIL